MTDTEVLLQRYRTDIRSMCAAFPEPVSAYKICQEFLDNFDEDVPFRRFGYMSFDSFLDDHPGLQKIFFDGKYCYRALINEATMEIQALIAGQKKNKKKKGGKKGRGGMTKVNLSRSFIAKNSAPPFLSQTMVRVGKTASFSYRTSYGPLGLHKSNPKSNKTALSNTWDIQPLTKSFVPASSASKSSITAIKKPAVRQIRPGTISVAEINREESPEVGVKRIMKALDKCGGKATLTKLNWIYMDLYKVQFDQKELIRHFGTKNMRQIHKLYLADKVELNTGYGGQWSFLSKENAQKQKEWESLHKSAIITNNETKKYIWAYPTVNELYEKIVEMLANMYPETIPINQIGEIYKRAHNVLIDTMMLYSKTWEDLILTTFSDKLQLTRDRRIALTQKFIKARNLNQQSIAQKVSTVKRVTASDLGLEYSEGEEDEEEEDEDEETASSYSSIVAPARSVSSSSKHLVTSMQLLSDRFIFCGPPISRRPPSGLNLSELSSVEQSSNKSSTTEPKEGRKSIFDRISKPGQEIHPSRIESQQTSKGVFDTANRVATAAVTKRTGTTIDASAFAPYAKQENHPAKTDLLSDQVDQLKMDKLKFEDLNQRMNSMDTIFQQEKAKSKPTVFSDFHVNSSFAEEDTLTGFGGSSLVSRRQNRINSTLVYPPTSTLSKKFEAKVSTLTVSPGQFNVRLNGRSEQLRTIIKSKTTTNARTYTD